MWGRSEGKNIYLQPWQSFNDFEARRPKVLWTRRGRRKKSSAVAQHGLVLKYVNKHWAHGSFVQSKTNRNHMKATAGEHAQQNRRVRQRPIKASKHCECYFWCRRGLNALNHFVFTANINGRGEIKRNVNANGFFSIWFGYLPVVPFLFHPSPSRHLYHLYHRYRHNAEIIQFSPFL